MIPLAIIGGGQIGLRHVEVALASPHFELVGIVEPSEPQRKALIAKGLPAVAALDDLATPAVAAVVATPTPAHHASAAEALDQGLALIVEKPLTATPDEGRTLIAKATAKALPLYCGHHRRCHPFSLAARNALPSLGPLVGLQLLWSLRKHDTYYDVAWRRAPGAGPLMTNLSHEIDLLRFLAGEITEVTALTANAARGFAIEDTAAIAFRMESGALASVLISDAGASPWAFEAATGENPDLAASCEDYLRALGTKGALAFPSLTRWTNEDGKEIEWRRALEKFCAPGAAKIDPLLAQINRFATVLNDGEDDVLCTAEDGLAATEWTLATALSAQARRPLTRADVPGNYRGV